MRVVSTALIIILATGHFNGQADSVSSLKKQRVAFAATGGVLTISSLIVLQQAWYSPFNTGSFHYFDDNRDWLQMDKAGHVYTTYQCGRLMMNAMKDLHYSRPAQIFVGGLSGFGYMTAIEVMDGYSKGWGFSVADQSANLAGSALAMMQEAVWKEQRIQIKFSYYASDLAKYNPALLGKNDYTRILKDYNAQTYWLSVSPFSFMQRTKDLSWICLSLGYSADGMLGGTTNNITVLDNAGNPVNFERYRKILLSADIDLTRIPVRSKALKKVFSVLNILKIPFPAIEWSRGGISGHAVYY